MNLPTTPAASKLLGSAYNNSSWVLHQAAYDAMQKNVATVPRVAARHIADQWPMLAYVPTVFAQAKEKLR